MRAQANRPTQADTGDAPAVPKGLIAEWLVLGPFSVSDAITQPEAGALDSRLRQDTVDRIRAASSFFSQNIPDGSYSDMVFGRAHWNG